MKLFLFSLTLLPQKLQTAPLKGLMERFYRPTITVIKSTAG